MSIEPLSATETDTVGSEYIPPSGTSTSPQGRREKNAELLRAAQSGNVEAREQLVCENLPLVHRIARRFCGRGTDYDDLCQIGAVGMMRAIDGFDLSLGTAFSTYAVPLIIGEIKRHLRDDGPIKVGRGLRRLGGILMRELYQILANTNEYTVDFSAATSREGYIVLRPVSLTFQTGTYEQARAIINAIGSSDNLNQISDVNIRAGQGASRSAVQTSLTITYFEVAP